MNLAQWATEHPRASKLANASFDLATEQTSMFGGIGSKQLEKALYRYVLSQLGLADFNGAGIRRACKVVGIKQTRKAIKEFLANAN